MVHQFTYDTAANHFNLLTSYTDPLSHTWTYGLDAAGKNVVSITNPLNKTWTINRLATGEPQWIQDPLLHRTTFGYDTYGHVTSVADHLGNTTTYTYDLTGRRLTMTDPRGFTTRYTYDFLSRLLSVGQPGGHAVQFEYDANSNLTKVTDPRGGQIVYTYTTMDWLDTRTDQLGRQEHYTYDPAGNVTQFQDRKNQFTTWAGYDARNRPTTVTYQDASTMTYNFDAAGRLWQLTDSLSGTITRTFDPLDRLTAETTPQGTIAYVPDDADRRISMIVAGQPDVTYLWDNANRLQTITRQGPPPLVATYGYDEANRRTQLTLPNGVVIDYGYDDANRLTGLTYSGLQGVPQSLTYAYDPAGNRVRTGGSWARTLLPAAVSGGTYDAANRQLTLGAKSMMYDDNGNLKTLTEASQTTTYTWDARDRLVGLTGPGLSASFAYNAKGRRAQKTINAFSSSFQYDGIEIVREVSDGSTVNYLRGPGTDETLARIEDGGTSCHLRDGLGSTVALSNSAGAVATEYSYEPFGRAAVTGAMSQNAFQFTGRENDGTGLHYHRRRYYGPLLSRFVREDPIGINGGINLYAYVRNNSVTLTDSRGTAPEAPGMRAAWGRLAFPWSSLTREGSPSVANGLGTFQCVSFHLPDTDPRIDLECPRQCPREKRRGFPLADPEPLEPTCHLFAQGGVGRDPDFGNLVRTCYYRCEKSDPQTNGDPEWLGEELRIGCRARREGI